VANFLNLQMNIIKATAIGTIKVITRSLRQVIKEMANSGLYHAIRHLRLLAC
jgi:hypothetical protein